MVLDEIHSELRHTEDLISETRMHLLQYEGVQKKLKRIAARLNEGSFPSFEVVSSVPGPLYLQVGMTFHIEATTAKPNDRDYAEEQLRRAMDGDESSFLLDCPPKIRRRFERIQHQINPDFEIYIPPHQLKVTMGITGAYTKVVAHTLNPCYAWPGFYNVSTGMATPFGLSSPHPHIGPDGGCLGDFWSPFQEVATKVLLLEENFEENKALMLEIYGLFLKQWAPSDHAGSKGFFWPQVGSKLLEEDLSLTAEKAVELYCPEYADVE